MQRALLIVNPIATATTARAREVLVSALGRELKLDVAETQHRGHAWELAAWARREGYDAVVGLGGDGTVNEMANGLLQDGLGDDVPALGVVPTGSTNVFARNLGFANDAVEATGQVLESLAAGATRVISLGTANDRYFTFCAGIGLDADVVQAMEVRRAKGKRPTGARFVRATLRHFFTTADRRHPALTLHQPGEEPVTDVFMAVASNCSPWTYLGNTPVDISPRASFETGLDVFGLTSLSTFATVKAAAQALASDKGPRGRRVLELHDLAEITATADRPLAWHVDGDDLGHAESVRFASVPAALRVIAATPA